MNPFDDGVALLTKLHKIGVHFQYSQKRRSDLWEMSKNLGGPTIKFAMDYNETRVAAQTGHLKTVVRPSKGLKGYAINNPNQLPPISEVEWECTAEFLCVFQISGLHTTIVQAEAAHTGAIGHVFKVRMMRTSVLPLRKWLT